MEDITLLRERVDYIPETGRFFWKVRPRSDFRSDRAANAYNARHAGRPAFTCLDQGYLTGRIDGKKVRAHRVAWAIMTGQWPALIRHINGDRSDNRWSNLRDAGCHQENGKNRGLSARNKSGIAGVCRRRDNGKWVATIGSRKAKIYLGQFNSLEEAAAAKRAAEKVYGYHPNHGKR